jgi:molybdopterin converting factor subunit 1
MRVLYFAWLRQRTGTAAEDVSPPASVTDVASLLDWLKMRGPGHAAALKDLSAVRVAVNQEFARPDQPLKPGDEVALFPPVTGG